MLGVVIEVVVGEVHELGFTFRIGLFIGWYVDLGGGGTCGGTDV